MKEQIDNEKVVDDNMGLNKQYLHFAEDKRIVFTFTNWRTIEDPNHEGKMIYSWTCTLLTWDGSPADKDAVLKVGHVDFRHKMNDLLDERDRNDVYRASVKIVGSDGRKKLYDIEDFEKCAGA